MKIVEERELRGLASDLVLDWYSKGSEGVLENASIEDFKHLIRAARVLADEAGHSLDRWVDAGRHAGLSWADVGDVLGVSRQAAQQRFTHPGTLLVGGRVDPDGAEDLICRTGMNAFNEVAVLRQEGLDGNQLVGIDFLKLFFAARGRTWENARVTALRGTSAIKQHEEEGWTFVATWYPFHYFTRPGEGAGDEG